MSKKFLVLDNNERKAACDKKQDVVKQSEQFYNDLFLRGFSESFGVYFEILKDIVIPAASTSTNAVYKYWRKGNTPGNLDIRFCFEFGAFKQSNGGSSANDFIDQNAPATDWKLALGNFSEPETFIPNALKKIMSTWRFGLNNSPSPKPSVDDLQTTSVEKKIIELISERMTFLKKKLTDKKSAGGAEQTEDEARRKLKEFIKALSPDQALHQLIAFYPEAYTGQQAWNKISNSFPSSVANSSNKKKIALGFSRDGSNLIDLCNNKKFSFQGGALESWKNKITVKVNQECGNLPDAKGQKKFSPRETKDRDNARLQNLQCILPMLEEFYARNEHVKLQELYPFHQNVGFRGDSVALENAPDTLTRKFYKGKQFPLVFANSQEAAFFINKLYLAGGGTVKTMEAFTELTNAEASQLVPKIEIYKIRYVPANSDNEILVPIDFSRKAEITANGHYNREDAGVERIKFKMLGRNPAEVDKYISCEISLYFDSINAFLKERESNAIDGNKAYKYSYKDFLMRTTKQAKTNNSSKAIKKAFEQFKSPGNLLKKDIDKQLAAFEAGLKDPELILSMSNEKYFRIRIDLGWQPYEGLSTNLKKFLETSNMSLYLTLQTHTFSFASDGSVSLKLNYMGSVEGQLIQGLQTNIFISEKINRANRARTALNQILTLIDVLSDEGDDDLIKIVGNLTQLRKNVVAFVDEAAVSKQKQMFDNLKADKSFIRELDRRGEKMVAGPTHILKGSIPPKYAGFGSKAVRDLLTDKQKRNLSDTGNMVVSTNIVMDKLMEDIRAAARKDTTAKADLSKIKYSMVKVDSSSGKFKSLATRKRPPLGPTAQKELLQKKYKSSINNHTLKKLQGSAPVEFYFTRFGSLLYSAIESIWHENPQALKDVVFVLGPIKFLSPYTGKYKYTNFAQLPILLDTWNNFFSKKVLAEGPQGETTRNSINYPLMRYFHDLVNNLLLNGVLASCGDRTNATNPLRFVEPKVSIFTAKRSSGFAPNNLGGDEVKYYGFNTSLDITKDEVSMRHVPKPAFDKNLGTKHNDVNIKNFVVLYDGGFSGLHVKSKDRYNINMNKNIMHFFIGANRGILRDVRFDKSDIRGFQEAKVLDEGDIEGGLLREKYDANVSVLGTSYFMQGMKFYLDPTFVGMSPDAENTIQRDIGLGGYYVITDVHSDITPNDFETTMHGSWVSYGKGKK